jgi:uncharacterized membrane protein YbhN (UPF0104 family)
MRSLTATDEFCDRRRSDEAAMLVHLPSTTPRPAAVDLLPDRRRLALRLALVAAVIGALALAVSSLPGLGEVRERLADASLGWLGVALVLQSASCLAFVAAFRGVFSRRLPWRLSYSVGMAAQGTNVLLPSGGAGGLALAAWALRRTGMPADRLARRTVAFYVLTSSVNFLTAAIAGSLLAVGILSGGDSLLLSAGPAGAALVVIAVVLALPRLLARLHPQQRSGRTGHALAAVDSALSGGIADARLLVRSGNPQIILGAIGFMALDVAALGAAFWAIGGLPPAGILLLAYVLGQLGGLIPLPGGVGGADGGLIAAFVLYGTPLGTAAAAVLAYRAFQLGLPALLGALAIVRLPAVLERAAGVTAPCVPPPPAPTRQRAAVGVPPTIAAWARGQAAAGCGLRWARIEAAQTPPIAPKTCACQEMWSCGSSPCSRTMPQTPTTSAPTARSTSRLLRIPRETRYVA